MSLHPVPALWFEVLIPSIDSARTAGALARTGRVELEIAPAPAHTFSLEDLGAGLARFRRLRERYAAYWAEVPLAHSQGGTPLAVLLEESLARLEAWREAADPLIVAHQAAAAELGELALWQQVLRCGSRRRLEIGRLAHTGPVLDALLAVVPEDCRLSPPRDAVILDVPHEGGRCLLAVGAAAALAPFRDELRAARARVLRWPEWLRPTARESLEAAGERHAAVAAEAGRAARALAELAAAHDLGTALGDLQCLAWFDEQIGQLPATPSLTWITGWSSDPDGSALEEALEREGARALIRFRDPPERLDPPQILSNPWWAKPFEMFSTALGVPGRHEVDPSMLLALLVPLLFGYMFGDVGQGLVILGVGWVLRRRVAIAPLLMAAGASAAVFGFVFGSVFSLEHVIPALWVHPMDAPVLVLTVPLIGAVLLLTLGQLLSGLEAAAAGHLREWWLTHAGFVLFYVALAASLAAPDALPLAVAGLAWFLAGRIYLDHSALGIARALGELVEDGMRLAVNTISFARVGAFALAHAGLSSAFVTLSEAASGVPGQVAVLVLGNLVIITLETLVVGVQTTRLVLFEFFVRFLRGEGRGFRPLPPPPPIAQGETHETAR